MTVIIAIAMVSLGFAVLGWGIVGVGCTIWGIVAELRGKGGTE